MVCDKLHPMVARLKIAGGKVQLEEVERKKGDLLRTVRRICLRPKTSLLWGYKL
jgi:hypothetical protein